MISIFDQFLKRRHFQFKNRLTAASALGEYLKNSNIKFDRRTTLVLGIPRAGALTADIVSKKLLIDNFNLIIPRKLTDPDNKEQSIGAIMEDGFKSLNANLIHDLFITNNYLEKEIRVQIEEIKRRKFTYYQGESNYDIYEDIKRYHTIILVDDGAATGYTIRVTVKWIRTLDKKFNIPFRKIIIAIPISPKNVVNMIEAECDADVRVVLRPSTSTFHSVEQFHKNFDPISDDEVIRIMMNRKRYKCK